MRADDNTFRSGSRITEPAFRWPNCPASTLEKGYSTKGSLGHGFWMMLRSADSVHLLTGAAGTTVVITLNRIAEPPVGLGGMKIVVAPNSFKGSLSASEAAEAIAAGIRQALSRRGNRSAPAGRRRGRHGGGAGDGDIWPPPDRHRHRAAGRARGGRLRAAGAGRTARQWWKWPPPPACLSFPRSSATRAERPLTASANCFCWRQPIRRQTHHRRAGRKRDQRRRRGRDAGAGR